LIEQRLEEMKITPVDQRDVGIGITQRLDGIKAAESTADNHHLVPHPEPAI
jgi:hypothetical protein